MADDRLTRPDLNDAELDGLVASLDPLRGVAEGPMSEREWALLRRITADARGAEAARAADTPAASVPVAEAPGADAIAHHRVPRRPRRLARRRLAFVILATALAVVVGTVSVTFLRPNDAVATAPHPLGVTAIDESIADVLDAAIAQLEDAGGPAEALRESASISWKTMPAENGRADAEPMVYPIISRLQRESDGSSRRLVATALPYPSDGTTTTDADRVVPQGDTVTEDTVFAPGELYTPYDDLSLGASIEEVRAILYVGEEPAAWDVFSGVNRAFRSLTLSNAQQAQVLTLLKDVPGLRVMGTATDRLGRPVAILQSDPVPITDVRETLHLSLETGRIVGAESFLAAPLGKMPAGAVVLYTAWDVSGFLPE